MKYKNRLIVPTLVSTSLLASTMVANAEEVDQDEQYQNPSTEEYAVSEEESERELDFIEAEENEASEEDSEDEALDEADEESSELEETEEAETAGAEEADENNIDQQAAEEPAEAPVEEPTEVNTVEEESAEPAEEQVEETAEPAESEETVETAAAEEVVEEDTAAETESAEEPAEPAEEPVQETQESEEVQTEETDATEEADSQETEQPAETESVTEPANEEASAEVDESEEGAPETDEPEAAEETQSTEETETAETPQSQSEEAPTYKYNSDSLEEELENLSAEEQAAFLEENEDNIEADEQMLADLTESLALENEELNREEVYAAASTMSTMSLSDAITDINQYISDNNFDVAEIKYDYIPNLPKYAYHSDYGWEPENGEVGKPKGVVLHDVGNENSTIYGEIEYMSRNWENAFVHAFVDADNIIQVADTDYLAYGAGPVSNDMHMHVELMRYDNAHDFAKSINNYADYIANLLYKYKLPVVSAEETGEGTLYSHVAVSNHLGGTASPDPYEYFARFDYEYNDVINLIGQRYNDMYNKLTAPEISMPVEEGNKDLVAEVNPNNLGLYESVTDVRTKNADDLLGQQFRVVRAATYNYDDYYLLEDENGVSLGWMYAGDLTTSDYVPEAEEDENLEEEKPDEPEVPAEPEEEADDSEQDTEPETDEAEDSAVDDVSDDQTPEEDSDDNSGEENEEQEEPAETETPKEPAESEESISEEKEDTDNSTDNESNQNEEESNEFLEDEEANDIPDEDSDNESVSDDNETEEESASETPEASDDETEETDQPSSDNEESAESDVQEEGEVLSSIEDGATGIRVVSESDELDGKSLAVTVLNPSNAINAAHDLYDIHVLDENGLLYNLQNPVTVYLPANGYVSNVYYLGDIGETLEAVNYRTEDGYAVFNVNSFSQYAVVYGNDNEDNTALPVLTSENDTGGEEGTADKENEHQTVYTEQDVDSADETAPAASNDVSQDGSGEDEETQMLPDTGTPAQNTSILAAILAALGLGFLVKRRKTIEK
ncbi:N-acetylmuramoyl-L-alanine amidase [Jeotgalicoccus halotolerans]|uniref:N-acetylmuramoyl-L-alanine amidase n=1 Tax=Jeotgalicoccus halotolerans TaxID=157227 RepID=UPI0035174E26